MKTAAEPSTVGSTGRFGDCVAHGRNATQPWLVMLTAWVGTLFIGCAADQQPVEKEPRPVRVVQAKPVDSTVERSFSGVVRAQARSRLSFRVSGRLISRPVDIGSELSRGGIVAELDPTDFRLRARQAAAEVERAQADAREAELEFARIRALYADDHATRRELDRALAAHERSRSVLEQARQRSEIARRELTYTRLTAPEAGLITDLFAEVGENLEAGRPVVAFIDQASSLEVEWSVPAGWIGRFGVGHKVAVDLPDLDLDTRVEPRVATVVEVGNAPRENGVMYPVIARFDEPAPEIRPGMAADISVRFEADTDNDVEPSTDPGLKSDRALILPTHAVVGDPEGYFVFVVSEAESGVDSDQRRVERRPVSVGRLLPQGLEILAGLENGETVVSAGADFLEDGQEVRRLRGDPLSELPSTSPRPGAAP